LKAGGWPSSPGGRAALEGGRVAGKPARQGVPVDAEKVQRPVRGETDRALLATDEIASRRLEASIVAL